MKVSGIKCPNCKDIIFSRANHDFRYCTCGDSFVDAGYGDYRRVGWKDEPEQIELELDCTPKDLYDDWNKSLDNYGLIKETK